MNSNRTFQSLRLKNFLSYGPKGMSVELEPLNVLIGQNASGKSNFIQALKLIRAMPTTFASQLYEGGGVREFIYRGSLNAAAEIEVDVDDVARQDGLRHTLTFREDGQKVRITQEGISSVRTLERPNTPPYYYKNDNGHFSLMALRQVGIPTTRGGIDTITFAMDEWSEAKLTTALDLSHSVIAQRNDPDIYPSLANLSAAYRAIRIYSNFDMEGLNSLRVAQRPDLPDDFLEESGRNLSMILNDLQHRGVLDDVVAKLKIVYDEIEQISVKISGGTVQTFIHERGFRDPIPATRLSDGTLRYLCLLAILLHPDPPPLICIEEPETGMHPDVISSIADLLVEASERMQLVVTTHSEMLVAALSHVPEAVIVCERELEGNTLRRLEPDALKLWLEKYTLGDLWLKGELGGTRW